MEFILFTVILDLDINARNYSDSNISKRRNNNIKIKPSQKAELYFFYCWNTFI